MRYYPKQMREWAAGHRANGNVVAASDLECAADQMDRLIDEIRLLKKSNEAGPGLLPIEGEMDHKKGLVVPAGS